MGMEAKAVHRKKLGQNSTPTHLSLGLCSVLLLQMTLLEKQSRDSISHAFEECHWVRGEHKGDLRSLHPFSLCSDLTTQLPLSSAGGKRVTVPQISHRDV
jgi:hypothetical protein